MGDKKYDVILFGATSFVGQILARYLTDQFGVNGELKWAAAGRSGSKLDAVKDSLGPVARELPLLIADASDDRALADLCQQTRVIVSTVGPYALYGEPMVKACVASGTDYCDLTGEVQWIKRMVSKYEKQAEASGARIVHCCGFDSIPSDLGVYFLQQQAKEKFGESCEHVKMRVKKIRGEFSGGTVASLMNVVKEVKENPELRKELANPYSICPEGHGFKARQDNISSAKYDPDFQSWMAPFVMAAINTRVVHRSNALTGNSYGDSFRYDEAVLTGKGLKGGAGAFSMMGVMAGFMLATTIKPTRWVLERYVVPKPGEGPSPESQKNGFYDIRFYGETASGESIRCKVTGDEDPGYGSTAKMLGQAAVCLAKDIDKVDKKGGFWTPSTAMGDKLIERLTAHSGLAFEVLES
ncbi:saccharopine dehydrogenase [Hahella sp. CCB-MM4]|uniref:saccharopine dehydrogenase family protein n=1 Tax=Hahella sp. (strain CCB-MM4) TaxID=1926491 RepID=UPI000B9AC35A|nr:saccharopine dehydrogenase NADP-binding domain-containing protein [Hahella sp. CCB-MM4]OZG73796.1 saccharopine dehydrogenase [Hahella sp. CCB-MM4]